MVTKATVKGSIQSGKTPVVEYKKQSDASWNTIPDSDVSVSGTSFTATLTGLTASTTYVYRVNVDGTRVMNNLLQQLLLYLWRMGVSIIGPQKLPQMELFGNLGPQLRFGIQGIKAQQR